MIITVDPACAEHHRIILLPYSSPLRSVVLSLFPILHLKKRRQWVENSIKVIKAVRGRGGLQTLVIRGDGALPT